MHGWIGWKLGYKLGDYFPIPSPYTVLKDEGLRQLRLSNPVTVPGLGHLAASLTSFI